MSILYRADSRKPEEIFKIGFKPKKAGGVQIQPGGQMIGGVSTSTEAGVALHYAACYDGWVYSVWAEGINVVDFLMQEAIAKAKPGFNAIGGVMNGLTQSEIACGEIPNTAIIAARQSRTTGSKDEFFGLIEVNLNCTLDPKTISLGMGLLADK